MKKPSAKTILDGKGVERVLSRLTHEILGKNKGAAEIVLVGIASGGLVLLAYLILALVIPQAPYAAVPGAPAGWAAAGAPAGWAAAPSASTGWTTPPAAPAWDRAPAFNHAAAPAASPRAKGQGIGAAAIFGTVLIVIGAIALADAVFNLPKFSCDLDEHSLFRNLILLKQDNEQFTKMFQELLEWMKDLPQS